MSNVRTRIAPSPTGYPHIGTIYQAMFDYVFAHRYEGDFIVRIEDTDRNRFVEGAEDVIFASLKWFGLEGDESAQKGGDYGPYRSSERLVVYKKYVDQLIKDNHAYRCFCTKERLDEMRQEQQAKHLPTMYDGHCRYLSPEEVEKNLAQNMPFVVRMRIPENETITFHDALLGDISFKSDLIDDQVILKSDGFPTYHLAVVVDDYLMKISHIFRGQEWVPSTPKHILLYRYLGWEKEIPFFIHLPVILNSQGGGKLSKRHGHSSVDYYRNEGFLPEAILNYLSNIVWNHPEGKEIYPLKELEKAFHINQLKSVDIHTQGPKFDLQKLEWVNGEYIRKMTNEELADRLENYLKDIDHIAKNIPSQETLLKLVPLIKERIKKLSDFIPLTDFFFGKPEYDMDVFNRLKIKDLRLTIGKISEKLEQIKSPWDAKEFEETFKALAIELQISNLDMFQLIRVAISGQLVTPPLFESIQILDEDETKSRLNEAVNFLDSSR